MIPHPMSLRKQFHCMKYPKRHIKENVYKIIPACSHYVENGSTLERIIALLQYPSSLITNLFQLSNPEMWQTARNCQCLIHHSLGPVYSIAVRAGLTMSQDFEVHRSHRLMHRRISKKKRCSPLQRHSEWKEQCQYPCQYM